MSQLHNIIHDIVLIHLGLCKWTWKFSLKELFELFKKKKTKQNKTKNKINKTKQKQQNKNKNKTKKKHLFCQKAQNFL